MAKIAKTLEKNGKLCFNRKSNIFKLQNINQFYQKILINFLSTLQKFIKKRKEVKNTKKQENRRKRKLNHKSKRKTVNLP